MKDQSSDGSSERVLRSIVISAELATALDGLPALVWVSGPDKGGIFFNKAWLDHTGRTMQQESGEGWTSGVHPDDLPALQGCADAFVEHRAFEIEFRLRRRDGAWRWLLDKAGPRFAADGSFLGYIGCCVDVTERKEAEAKLHANERRITNIVESISDGFATVDRDWRITYVNPIGEKVLTPLMGSTENLVGRSVLEAIPQIPGTPFLHAYRKAMDEQVSVEIEAYYPPLGSWFDVRCYPTPDGIAVHFLDVGLRKRAEDALRKSEERFRAMADNLPLIVWVRDAEGRLEFVNETFCEYFGVSRGHALQRGWQLATHPEDSGAYSEEFRRCVRERRPFRGEIRLRRADGEWRWLESWAKPRFAESGEFLGHVGTSADITERKRTDEVRKLLLMELNHRAKNTLAIVQAIAHQSLASDKAPDEQRTLFENRLSALAGAHDILTRENWEKASLADLITAAAKSCGADPARLVASGPEIILQAKQSISVTMALHELCTNAMKYGALCSPGGHVTVGWEFCGGNASGFRLVWTERGGPPVSPPKRAGFGTRLLERTLATELNAEVEMNYRPEGLTVVVSTRHLERP